MTVSPRLWLATFSAFIFLIGVSAGVLVDRAWLSDRPGVARFVGGPPGGMRGGPPDSTDRLIAELDAELQLTSEQRAKVAAILDARRTRIRLLQDEARRTFTVEQESLQKEIAAVLTAEQAVRFRELMAKRPRGFGPGFGPGLGPPQGRGGRGRGMQ
jgi:Spy/CpxP family protein refolding chaperone